MRNAKTFLALAAAAIVAAPFSPSPALADTNDYAPSLTPSSEPTPPPVDVTGTGGAPIMQGRGAMQGGGQGMRHKRRGGGKGGGAGRQRMMARFDTNGDGVLDDSERQQLQQFRAARGRGMRSGNKRGAGGAGANSAAPTIGNHYNGFPGPDGAVGGGTNLAQAQGPGGGGMKKEARRQKLIQRFDTNGDGKLDGSEQAAANAFREQRQQQRMMRMQQGGTGSGASP